MHVAANLSISERHFLHGAEHWLWMCYEQQLDVQQQRIDMQVAIAVRPESSVADGAKPGCLNAEESWSMMQTSGWCGGLFRCFAR